MENFKQNRQESKKSPWEKEMENALYFCETEEKSAREELGEFKDGSEGTLREEYRRKAEVLLYEFMRNTGEDKLPEKVLIEKTKSSKGITLDAGSIGAINLGGSRGQKRYFLPKQNIIYRIYGQFSTKKDGNEFDPDEPDFVGFDKIKDLKTEDLPYGFWRDKIGENSKFRNERLNSEEISIITNAFQEYFTGTDLEGSAENLIHQVNKILNEDFTERVKEVQVEHAERIKNRILQLIRVMVSQIKLPKYIQGTPVNTPEPGEARYYKTLNVAEEKLVIVPSREKRTLLRREIEVPDTTQERPADVTDWLKSGLLFKLRQGYISEKIKDAVSKTIYGL